MSESESESENESEFIDPDEAFKIHGSTWYEVSQKHWSQQDHNAVSYTHLTLPTTERV